MLEAIASSLPVPQASNATGPLSTAEEVSLDRCTSVIRMANALWWLKGQALHAVRELRLYRESHETFDAYLADEHDMTRQQASRLIQAYPLAQSLSPMGDKITERQVRELLPLFDQHGLDAVVFVYKSVAAAEGVKPTAKVLAGVVATLPEGPFDEQAYAAAIAEYLESGIRILAPEPQAARFAFDVEVQRVTSIGRAVIEHAAEDPEQAAAFAVRLRELAEEIEHARMVEG